MGVYLNCSVITRNLKGKLDKNKNVCVSAQPSSPKIPLRCMFRVPRTRVARIQLELAWLEFNEYCTCARANWMENLRRRRSVFAIIPNVCANADVIILFFAPYVWRLHLSGLLGTRGPGSYVTSHCTSGGSGIFQKCRVRIAMYRS